MADSDGLEGRIPQKEQKTFVKVSGPIPTNGYRELSRDSGNVEAVATPMGLGLQKSNKPPPTWQNAGPIGCKRECEYILDNMKWRVYVPEEGETSQVNVVDARHRIKRDDFYSSWLSLEKIRSGMSMKGTSVFCCRRTLLAFGNCQSAGRGGWTSSTFSDIVAVKRLRRGVVKLKFWVHRT